MALIRLFDPMVRLLVLAIVLAVVMPVQGSAREAAQLVANAAVFLLFLLNGLRLPRHEVIAGMGNHRLLLPLVVWVFGAMAMAGWAVSQCGMFWMPHLIALGFLYLGCLPSTVQSATAYSSLAGGNVASSVVAAALLNVVGVFVTAPLYSLLSGGGAAQFHGEGLIRVFVILLLPFAAGQLLQGRLDGWVRDHRPLVTWMDRSSIAIAVYVAFSGAVAQPFWNHFHMAGWIGLALGTAIMLLIGHVGAWTAGRLAGLDRANRISMLFAGAQKSIAMGAPLATVLFPADVAGAILLPVLLYHLAQLVLAAPLAVRLARR